VVPHTTAGQLTVLFYGVFAIPLMTIWLGSVGSLLGGGLECFYRRVACAICISRRRKFHFRYWVEHTNCKRLRTVLQLHFKV